MVSHEVAKRPPVLSYPRMSLSRSATFALGTRTKLSQVFPCVDSRGVAVRPVYLNRVAAHQSHVRDDDVGGSKGFQEPLIAPEHEFVMP